MVGHKLFSISCVCVCLRLWSCERVCVCSSMLRVHVQPCVVSPAGFGFFRTQSRSGRIAELWNQDQTSLLDVPHAIPAAESDVGDDPRRPEASQAACEGCGDPPLDAWTSTSTSGQLCPWTLRAAVRLVHDHVFGAVRQCCVRQVLSPVLQPLQGFCPKEASDDKLWKMKPKMQTCEVQSELLGNPREFWTYKDMSFTGVDSSMAHSCSGSATASTIPLRVLDTHRVLSR